MKQIFNFSQNGQLTIPKEIQCAEPILEANPHAIVATKKPNSPSLHPPCSYLPPGYPASIFYLFHEAFLDFHSVMYPSVNSQYSCSILYW